MDLGRVQRGLCLSVGGEWGVVAVLLVERNVVAVVADVVAVVIGIVAAADQLVAAGYRDLC